MYVYIHITVVGIAYSYTALACQFQSNNLKVIQYIPLMHTHAYTKLCTYVYIICQHKSACLCIHFKGTVHKFELSNCHRSCRAAKFHFISCHANNNEAATYWHLLKYLSRLIYIYTHTYTEHVGMYAFVGQIRNVAVKRKSC